MLLIPAIDLRRGQVVRLFQGRYDREKNYQLSPLEVAKQFAEAGAKLIHLVDLDAARTGAPIHQDLILELASKVKAEFEVGGGIRTIETISDYLERGVSRVIMGTAAHRDPELVEDALKKFPRRIVIGIDAKQQLKTDFHSDSCYLPAMLKISTELKGNPDDNLEELLESTLSESGRGLEDLENYLREHKKELVEEAKRLVRARKKSKNKLWKKKPKLAEESKLMESKVAISGWEEKTEISAVELAKRYDRKEVRAIIYTEIERDGTLQGPALKPLGKILKTVKVPVIASGGVSSLEDLLLLKKYAKDGLEGVIVGKAIYEGRINLREAIESLKGC